MTIRSLSIAIAQLNPVVGDVDGNLEKARTARGQAAALGADLVVFSELFLSGYPPEDLVLKPAFQEAVRAAAEALAADTGEGGPAVLIGAPWAEAGALHNAALLMAEGAIQAQRYKRLLPNFGVFDELRVFRPGPPLEPIEFGGARLGVMVCEDMWAGGPASELAEAGADFFLVLNGSPFRKTVYAERADAVEDRRREQGKAMLYVNQVGGQDSLTFDGASFALRSDGTRAAAAPAWREGVFLTRWSRAGGVWEPEAGDVTPAPAGLEAVYAALTLGVRDYVDKNRFPGVVIGLSGGIDSALTAAIAVDALGPDRVRCVMLPSRYTSEESLRDAKACAKKLGVSYETIAIEPAVDAFDRMLKPAFGANDPAPGPDLAAENIQSRIRGVLLMALSNKFGPMVLTTGNKSEMSVGYATLYGDMNGGYNPLKDVYKMEVFALSRWRNGAKPDGGLGPSAEVIPPAIIDKPPSAELRDDQRDDDSLPPYETLDAILDGLIERELSLAEIVAEGHPEETVRRVEHLLYVAEYKRRQAPPGPKVTVRNFDRDRRYPITNGFRDAR
ncbi:MAG: NAD+ synthase [Pseudomonadota bacterium]